MKSLSINFYHYFLLFFTISVLKINYDSVLPDLIFLNFFDFIVNCTLKCKL